MKKTMTRKPLPNMFEFDRSLAPNLQVFEGCGNILGIVPLYLAGYRGDWLNDKPLRRRLRDWGLGIGSDSVMVLSVDLEQQREQGYNVFMDVFEPRGSTSDELLGGVSDMCGNGIRAVAAFLRQFNSDKANEVRIMTRSGMRTVSIDKVRDLYTVNMGLFTSSPTDLAPYVNMDMVQPNEQGNFIDAPIPPQIHDQLSRIIPNSITTWSIGLTGDKKTDGGIIGEPHLVISIPKGTVANIQELRNIAVAAGPIITKNTKLFPQEMNVNFITLDDQGHLLNVTHERNLGDDSEHSVTAACGTGNTAVGAVLYNKNFPNYQSIVIKNIGGTLEISMNAQQHMIMTGPANRVK